MSAATIDPELLANPTAVLRADARRLRVTVEPFKVVVTDVRG